MLQEVSVWGPNLAICLRPNFYIDCAGSLKSLRLVSTISRIANKVDSQFQTYVATNAVMVVGKGRTS